MSNALVRLFAAAMTLGSIVTVAPAMAGDFCADMPVMASKEKPVTTAEAPKPEQPGS